MMTLPLLSFISIAFAKGAVNPEVAAEQIRLREEMSRLAQQDSWGGVERHYQQLLDLQRSDVALDFNDHMLGASASASDGDIEELIVRLQRALILKNDETALNWLEMLQQNTAQVDIRLSNAETVELRPEKLLYEQSYNESVSRAQETLSQSGSYRGRLPVGNYVLSTKTKSFEILISLDGSEKLVLPTSAKGSSELELKLSGVYLGTYAQYLNNFNLETAPRSHPSIGGSLGYGIHYSGEKWGIGSTVGFVGAGAFESTHALLLADLRLNRAFGRGQFQLGPQLGLGWGRVIGITEEHALTLCDPQVCGNWDRLKDESVSQTRYLNAGGVIAYQNIPTDGLKWGVYASGRFEQDIFVVSGGLILYLGSET